MINLVKMNRDTTKMERKVKKTAKKLKFLAILIGGMLAVALVFWLFMGVSKWYDENKVVFQYPILIKFQTPIKIEKRTKEVKKQAYNTAKLNDNVVQATPVPKTEFEVVNNSKYGQIMWKIYQLETQRGKTDNCRLTGAGFGGFGVMDDKGVACYESFEKAVERANYWFGLLKPENSLVDALCSWNKGTAPPPKGTRPVGGFVNCTYYQDYLSL